MPRSRLLTAPLIGCISLLALCSSMGRAQTFEVIQAFDSSLGLHAEDIMEGSDGVLYGTTSYGGAYFDGVIFRVNKDGTGFQRLYDFNGDDRENGASPRAALTEGSDGVLYGTTFWGGLYQVGIVFRIDKDGSGFAKVYDIQDGADPSAGVIEGSDGALYGTTVYGGAKGDGTIFKVNKDGTGYLKLHDFDKDDVTNGAAPYAGLIEGSDGALYGTTAEGGAYFGHYGVVFKINKDGTGFRNLHDFNGLDPNGYGPSASLLEGPDGALYGTTAGSDGTVFKISKDGTGFTKLHDFNFDDGSSPYDALVVGSDGALYGTTAGGGPYGGRVLGDGTVFKINSDGSGFANLHYFNAADAEDDRGPQRVIASSDGVLYGTAFGYTINTGPRLDGMVFKINEDGTGFLKLYDFLYEAPGGSHPHAELMEGSDGALYGTTKYGGASIPEGHWYGDGVIFKVSKDGTEFQTLHSFGANGTRDGDQPETGLLEGSDGALYGVADGGANGTGIVFGIERDGTGFAKLHDFGPGEDGADPETSLIEGSDGALYGTTDHGGRYYPGYGTLFKINKDGTGYQKLHDFNPGNPADGGGPEGLLRGSHGELYGTSRYGGASDFGTVFKINEDGTGFRKLHDFDSIDGLYPYSGLVHGPDGALYGTTHAGGSRGFGVVFRINTDGTGFQKLHDFTGPDGMNPEAELIWHGALYGTTPYGGAGGLGFGVAFRLNADGTGFEVLHHFKGADATNGAYPSAGLVAASDGAFYGTTRHAGPNGAGIVYRLTLPCEASVEVRGRVYTTASTIPVHVHVAHNRSDTVTVSWELDLIDRDSKVLASHVFPPHTFEPGDVVDKDVEFMLPSDLPIGRYTIRLGISEMAGTNGATTSFRVVRSTRGFATAGTGTGTVE